MHTYRAALIARYGLPPAGARFIEHANLHDSGVYTTLRASVDHIAQPEAVGWFERVRDALGTWLEAGFRVPVHYDDNGVVVEERTVADCIRSALAIVRRDALGRSPLPDLIEIDRNLRAALPLTAAVAVFD